MLAHEYQTMRTVEDTYWWYSTLRSMVVRELKGRLHSDSARVLDAGCGTGGMMARLRGAYGQWKIAGLDLSPHAVQITRERGFDDVTTGSVSELPFNNGSFDALVSLDVLYHDGVDQEKALSEFSRVLKPGGFVVLNLPAFKALAGSHDIAVKGVRRYTTADVRELLSAAGFQVQTLHYWNAWLFLPILAWRTISRSFHAKDSEEAKSDLSMLPGVVNGMLAAVSTLDARICSLSHWPFGTSVFAVATKGA
jgi:ubiquinone/menaquinone biosynthesis C-methylase UbiE